MSSEIGTVYRHAIDPPALGGKLELVPRMRVKVPLSYLDLVASTDTSLDHNTAGVRVDQLQGARSRRDGKLRLVVERPLIPAQPCDVPPSSIIHIHGEEKLTAVAPFELKLSFSFHGEGAVRMWYGDGTDC